MNAFEESWVKGTDTFRSCLEFFFFWCSDAHWLFREAPGVPRVFSMEDGINIRNEENRSSTLASMKFTVILASIAIAAGSTARSLTVYNACPFTIW